ncbi:MAG: dockerin type I domain-containing protein [Acutalibacteraceae bacterium]|nr:dockerin type I domain-containing protein [Acutalibacteraceae bacterium]
MKKLLSIIIVLCMVLVLVPVSASAEGLCSTLTGNNREYQNYSTYASPIDSYLVQCSDGKLMRVQSHYDLEGVLVEYYDTSYNLLSYKIIPQELPIFGGFYESKSNYFLITGQTNRDELNTTEVYRITKYDKSWNRLGSSGIYGANTTVPFDAGVARMVMCGNILFVHTSHEMYTAYDGYNHQANVTISMNADTMEIIRYKTSVSNSGTGYVSHSFNQFIQVKDNKIVTVDHGDAYPRSIIMLEHKNDASQGQFGNVGTKTDLLTFPGTIGDNYTGASIGGFEISDSTYLVAGVTVEHNSTYRSNKTRNVFLAVKSDSGVKLNMFTNYAEGEASASTPQLVKINNNKFMLLWSRNNTVYYTTVDANGNKTSQTYLLDGNLSDCKPVIIGDKLVWYVWNGTNVTFNEINIKTLRKNTVTAENGHKYEYVSTSGNIATLKCSKCSDTITAEVPTSVMAWWRTPNDTSGYYYSGIRGKVMPGDVLKLWLELSGGSSEYSSEIDVIIGDKSILDYETTSASSSSVFGNIYLYKAGKTTLTVKHKYNPALNATYNITVSSNATGLSFESNQITLNENDTYTLQPIFSPDGTSAICNNWSSSNTAVAKVDSTGKVTALKEGTAVITVKTDNGLSATCTVTVKKKNDLGDVNNNGEVTVTDAIIVMKYCVGETTLDSAQFARADVNKSGTVTVADAVKILGYSIGAITEF